MDIVQSSFSLTYRLLRYLILFFWDVILPILGLRPEFGQVTKVMFMIVLVALWAYWIALAIAR
ncbi:MAG: hypothetical protein JWN23_2831 [Rhodocyclales bacterium]|nr:hypothetical protein [Rhodocyclales bacterium]